MTAVMDQITGNPSRLSLTSRAARAASVATFIDAVDESVTFSPTAIANVTIAYDPHLGSSGGSGVGDPP